MPLLTTTSAFGLGRKRWSSPQQCYLHRLCTLIVDAENYLKIILGLLRLGSVGTGRVKVGRTHTIGNWPRGFVRRRRRVLRRRWQPTRRRRVSCQWRPSLDVAASHSWNPAWSWSQSTSRQCCDLATHMYTSTSKPKINNRKIKKVFVLFSAFVRRSC